MSLNAWGGAKYDALAAWLPDVGADIVCLQEVTRTPAVDGWTTYRDDERELRQRANLFADLDRLLIGYQGSFVASDAGPIATAHGVSRSDHRQDFGLAAFVHDKLPVVGQMSEFVHGSFTDHDLWPSDGRPRLAQGLRVLDRDAGRFVTIVHLHGLRETAGKGDSGPRRRQAEQLVRLVERLRSPDDVTVVCGDLNLLPGSETFAILGDIGLVDLVGSADTRTSVYRKPVRNANYMLVSDPSTVRELALPATPEVSDHRPLILDI